MNVTVFPTVRSGHSLDIHYREMGIHSLNADHLIILKQLLYAEASPTV